MDSQLQEFVKWVSHIKIGYVASEKSLFNVVHVPATFVETPFLLSCLQCQIIAKAGSEGIE